MLLIHLRVFLFSAFRANDRRCVIEPILDFERSLEFDRLIFREDGLQLHPALDVYVAHHIL